MNPERKRMTPEEEKILEDKITQERQSLAGFLTERHFTLETISGELGPAHLDKIFLGLAIMEQQLGAAAQAAKAKDIGAVADILGAGAKITKDNIYAVLIEAYGGPVAILNRGMTGVPAVLRDYIMEKYAGGERQCVFFLQQG